MPRAPSEKTAEAKKLFDEGMKLTDIAKSLGVPEGTVRSWKNRGKWGAAPPKKTNVTLQKIQKMKMQRCRKRSVEVSQEIAMQKEEKVVALRPGTGMLKGMELIQKYIGMHLTMKIFNY